jgi:hypothetical protein
MPMSPGDLKSLLQAERADSLGGLTSSQLSSDRTKAMDYYYGDMTDDMPSPKGGPVRSQPMWRIPLKG